MIGVHRIATGSAFNFEVCCGATGKYRCTDAGIPPNLPVTGGVQGREGEGVDRARLPGCGVNMCGLSGDAGLDRSIRVGSPGDLAAESEIAAGSEGGFERSRPAFDPGIHLAPLPGVGLQFDADLRWGHKLKLFEFEQGVVNLSLHLLQIPATPLRALGFAADGPLRLEQ